MTTGGVSDWGAAPSGRHCSRTGNWVSICCLHLERAGVRTAGRSCCGLHVVSMVHGDVGAGTARTWARVATPQRGWKPHRRCSQRDGRKLKNTPAYSLRRLDGT